MKVSAIPSVTDVRPSLSQRPGAQGSTTEAGLRETSDVAADRARWLSELAIAVVQAKELAWRLGSGEGPNPEARALYARLGAVLDEVETLRCGSWSGAEQELDPFWRQLLSCPPAAAPTEQPGDQVPFGSSPPPENGSRNGSSLSGFQPDVATNARLRKARLP